MSETLKLHHGTSFDIVGGKVANGKEDLFGKRNLEDSGWSGTLTDVFDYAKRIALRRGNDPIVLTYEIPVEFVKDEGLVGMQSIARGFVTTIEVPFENLPIAYIRAVAQLNMTNEEILRFVYDRNKISFHKIPKDYFVSSVDI